MQAAITVRDLGKCYKVDHQKQTARYHTLREALIDGVSGAWKRLRGQRKSRLTEDFWALRDVDLEIYPGEVVGIIGRNGAGKSTLLKILSRITKPTTGAVKLRGRVGSLLEVGTGFHPELTGRENVYLNGSILGMSRREIKAKFDAIVDFSGVEKFLDTPVKRYSSGMYVRLAFAVAAHLEPEILIVDEVLAVGDMEFQRKCLGQMENLSHSGRTILFVSHNMSAIEGLCRRGLLLNAGRVVFQGDRRDVINRYMEESETALPRGRLDLGEPTLDAAGPVARIVSARVTSRDRHSDAGYPAGEPLEFQVSCRSRAEILRPSLGIGIDNSLGQRVVTFHTDFGSRNLGLGSVRGSFQFVCRISSLALSPGDYRIKFSLEASGDPVHVLDEAMILTILPTDYYGNGGKYGRGLILCRQDWEMLGG